MSNSLMRCVLLLTLFTISFTPIYAQNLTPNSANSRCSDIASQVAKRKKAKILSFGVLNGKAINLVKPEYPISAQRLNVRGTVVIQIIIDETGCVVHASVISGHPFLIASALKAAYASTFLPVMINNEPRRVTGVINYNFLPNTMNWLELGFASGTLSELLEFLPSDRSNIRMFIENVPEERQFDSAEIQKIGELIDTELASNPKDQWLFRLGKQFKIIDKSCWGTCSENISVVRQLLDLAPSNVSPDLIVRVRELVFDNDIEDIRSHIQSLRDRLFDLGN